MNALPQKQPKIITTNETVPGSDSAAAKRDGCLSGSRTDGGCNLSHLLRTNTHLTTHVWIDTFKIQEVVRMIKTQIFTVIQL